MFHVSTGGARYGGFCLFFFFFFVKDGEEIGMVRLDDRTLHVFAGGMLFGDGIGRTYKGEDTQQLL